MLLLDAGNTRIKWALRDDGTGQSLAATATRAAAILSQDGAPPPAIAATLEEPWTACAS